MMYGVLGTGSSRSQRSPAPAWHPQTTFSPCGHTQTSNIDAMVVQLCPCHHRRARGERARSPPAKLAMARMGSPTVRRREHLRSAACCLSFRPLLRLEPGTKDPVDLLPEREARRGLDRVAPLTGSGLKYPPTNFCAKEHRSCVDGRATARHLHGKMERAVRCLTVKVSAESADAVSR